MRSGKLRDSVLIADSDVERAERTAAACAARGIDVEIATHGARALEIALSELPVAIVAQLDLPLIEGTRLAEILRSNPRTTSIGVLFVADERSIAPESGAAGRVIPGHADPETIVHFVEALLLKHRPPRGEAEEPIGGIEGELAQLALTELIELFHVNRKTGVIALERGSGRRRETGQVVLRGGDVIHASCGAVEGEKALYRLFAWDRGQFRFVPDDSACDASVERPTRALLREGRRQAGEWQSLVDELPTQNARVVLIVPRQELPSVLHPLTQEVLLALEVSDRVDQILDRCSFPDYQVLRTLTTLLRRGLVELQHDAGDDVARGASPVLPRGLATRLRERLDPQRVGLDAKVLVIASGEDASASLSRLIGRVPGAEIPERPVSAACITPLCRLAVDDETAIEWLLAPASGRFAPVWPMAAHGALAVVFLHTAPIDFSVETLRPAIDAIGQLPRVRPLHLLLLDKPDDGSVAEVCEALSLFDDRSVVEIPIGVPDAAEEGLRELLRRVLG
jgi:CheY-like chemotaxis protein